MIKINIAKAGRSIEIDFDKLPEQSKAYIIEYGLRQSLNDAVAGVKEADFATEEDFKAGAFALACKRAAAIETGELRQSGPRLDPVEAEVMRMAKAIISNAILAKGGKLKDYKMADLTKRAEELLAKGDNRAKLEAKAREVIAAKAEVIDGIEL